MVILAGFNCIVAFHGLQGSGKTTWADFSYSVLNQSGMHPVRYNIKHTFSSFAEKVYHPTSNQQILPNIDEGKKILAWKELQKAISMWAEKFDREVWSREYERFCLRTSEVVVTDDIRTPQNLESLLRLVAEGKKVVLFRLTASEEVRKERCSAWREDGCVLEDLLPMPTDLPESFFWVDLDTSFPKEKTKGEILKKLGKVIEGFNASI